MYRASVVLVALLITPSLAAAQQTCTPDANQVINELYRHMLERAPDPGASNWTNQLQRGEMNVKQVVRAIATSQEHSERFWRTEAGEEMPHIRSVNRLYRHVLGRQPDAAGARHWATVAAQSGPNAVVDQLINSAEYNNQYGDWGVPGSGGIRFCGPNNQGASNPQVIQVPQQNNTAANTTQDAARFRGMDRNNDGRVERNEWRGSARSFEVHDWNNDGVLSGDELRPGSARIGRTIQDEDFETAEQFENLDVNNNNRIELREWHSTAAAFDQLDINNDNFLTRAELSRTTSNNSFGATGTAGRVIVVNARQAWTDTGIDVTAGDTIMFESEGTVRLSDDGNDIADPRGARSNRRAAGAPLQRTTAGALIARIGNGGINTVGDRRSVRANQTGRLYLGINDDHLADNSGEFRVMVDVRER
jgi:Ca2+-binding EF-hand superfamily protein